MNLESDGDGHCIVFSLNSLQLPCYHSEKIVFLQSIVMLWPLLVSTVVTVEWRPHPLECDWPLSCVSKATRRWKLYQWNNSPPLRWRIWSQAPSTIWGFTPMSTTASAAHLSPLKPKQVRPHQARWNQGSSQVGYSGCKSLSSRIYSNSVKYGWVIMVCFFFKHHTYSSKGNLKVI